MVAENIISTLSQNVCEDYDNVTLGDVPCVNLTNGHGHGNGHIHGHNHRIGIGAPLEQFDGAKIHDQGFKTYNIHSNSNDNDNAKDKDNYESDKTNGVQFGNGYENGISNGCSKLEESSLDSFCDVVVSFRCKFCAFIATDRNSMKLHVGLLHSTKCSSQAPADNVMTEHKTELEPKLRVTIPDLSVLKTSSTELLLPSLPSVPVLLPCPPSQDLKGSPKSNQGEDEDTTLDQDHGRDQDHDQSGKHGNETTNKNGNENENNSDIVMGSETEKDEVFFCSQCSIIFSSAVLCCNHMVEVHQLREFSTELIRENPLNANPQPCPPKRKRIRCSKQSQPTPAPVTDRLSKRCRQCPNSCNFSSTSSSSTSGSIISSNTSNNSVEHMCKLCKTKFRTLAAMQTHEKCHISVVDGNHTTNTTKKSKSYKSYIVKGYTCCFCDADGDKTVAVGRGSGSGSAGSRTEGGSNDNGVGSGVGTGTGAGVSLNGSSASGSGSKPGAGSGAAPVAKFLTWAKCAYHLWKDHEVDCDLYTCSVCKYKTPTSAKLKDHELVHSSEAKFSCSTCRKSFKQFKQLKNHEKYHKTNNTKLPPPSEARWYTPKECPVCNRILSDSKCLKKHISAVHNKMKPYVCNICGHTSARKAELQLHIRQHTGEKPYKCPACPFSTGDHNSLRKHKQRHAGDRPYECSYCDYSAIQSHAFKKHVLAVHPGQEIVFVCGACGLACVNETSFDAHRKDHEDGRLPVQNAGGSGDSHNGLLRKGQGSHGKSSSSISNVDDSTRASTESESNDGKASKFWLRDEDSMEVVDTGGITIPAPVSSGGPHSSPSSGSSSSSSSSSGSGSDTMDREDCESRTATQSPPTTASQQCCTHDKGEYSGSVMHQDENHDHDLDRNRDHDEEQDQDSHIGSNAMELGQGKDTNHLLTSSPSKCFGEMLSRHEAQDGEDSVNGSVNGRGTSPAPSASSASASASTLTSNFGLGLNGLDESRAISIVTELLSDSDCNTLHQFLNFDPVLCSSDSIDLPDLLCNEHSNDGTLEKLLNMNVTGF